jgi:hypothetical protein
VSHGLNKIYGCTEVEVYICDTVCAHTPFNFCYNISLSSTEIDSDEPYRDLTLEIPGCNEETNVDYRDYLRERVQQFLTEYVEYNGLSTGSGSEGYTD